MLYLIRVFFFVLFFFFQAEDGIRDLTVTGVQTCALPISRPLALMMPAVTVKVNASPRGLPIASAHSPTRVESEFPNRTVGRFRASILISATSVFGSVPTTCAVN